jgi:hypothetical protein
VANAQKTKSAGQQAQPFDKLYMENTLLRVAGALFCHDQKRAATHTHEIELNRGVKDKRILIRPNARYGQPGPLAHKVFVAIIKKHSDYGRPVRDEVSFTQRELARLIGREQWGGSASDQIIRALQEIQSTFIETGVFNKERNQWIEHTFNIFPEITIARRDEHSPTMEGCSVLLARPILASLKDNHFTCLNHFLMGRLGSIGQALYMRLFYHFANLYDGHHKDRLKFEKRYDDICAEWLGGLKVLLYKSDILKDQLGGHLKQLVEAGLLSSWHLEKAQTREGFVISFRPGPTFFADYARFYRNQHQSALQWNYHADRREIGEPLKVARLFQEKLLGKSTTPLAFVSPKDVETARQILTRVDFGEVPAFIDYALAEAKKTKFDVKTLGGLKQYLAVYFQSRVHRVATKATAAAVEVRRRQEADQLAYERFRRSFTETLFSSLPAKERASIEQLAHNKAPQFAAKGSLAKTMYEIEKNRITATRYANKIPAFDDWKSLQRR